MKTLIFLTGAGCGGDTISWLNAEEPDFQSAIRDLGIDIAWHPSFTLEKGEEAIKLIQKFIDGKRELDILMVEGATPTGPDGSGSIFESFGRPFIEVVRSLAAVAKYTVAVGTCAASGGISSQEKDIVKAKGLQWEYDEFGGVLGEGYKSKAKFPVINISGCPAHPDWILETLFLLINDRLSAKDLDYANRPSLFFNNLAHHACPRNEYYEFKASAKELGQQGCLFEFLGCRGTQCESDCNLRLWLGRTGSCTRGGYPCIACTAQTFPIVNCNYFQTELLGNIPKTLPRDVPKAWYIGMSGLSKMATPERLKINAESNYNKIPLKKEQE